MVERVHEARYINVQEGRWQIYKEVDRIIIDQAPMMIAGYSHGLALLKPWVKRYPISPIPPWDKPFWQDVIIEPH